MISPVAAQHLGSMILGAVTEGGLWQSAVLMSDLKAAYLVQASPKIMFFGQILGSILGAFVGSGIYRVFTRVYEIPSAQFPVPFAYMWANTARLAAGGQLPDGVKECFWVMFGLAAALRVMALVAGKRSWAKWIPSGVAIAIGILPPSLWLTFPLNCSRNVPATACNSCKVYRGLDTSVPIAETWRIGIRYHMCRNRMCTRRRHFWVVAWYFRNLGCA
jgi:uncharacterized oligopeptide transporter (OPT) family protein